MRVEAMGISKGQHALPPIDVVMESGRAVFVEAETEQRPTVLGLIVSGRMRPDAGEVTLDGERDSRRLRRAIALVDAPDVSEPHGNVLLVDVVAEELMFAGRVGTRITAKAELERLGLRDQARVPVGELEPGARVRVLCSLALKRKDVTGLVLVSPDRHGGEPSEWWQIACELADEGAAVLVIAGKAARAAIAARPDGWGTGRVMPLDLTRRDYLEEDAE